MTDEEDIERKVNQFFDYEAEEQGDADLEDARRRIKIVGFVLIATLLFVAIALIIASN